MTSTCAAIAPPWLSVLVPVYNVADYLAQCVESIMTQADEGLEVLLLNDASTDESAALAEQLQARWPQSIHLLHHPVNRGLSAARNSLLQACTGDYVWFLDSDDFLKPGAIAQLKAALQTPSAPDWVMCDFALWRAKPKLKHRLRGESHRASFLGPAQSQSQERAALLRGLLLSGQMHAWSKITRRQLWLSSGVRFPEGAYFEDMSTMPRLALHASSFVYLPRPWVAYRQREGSILSAMTARKASDLAGALGCFAQQWREQAQLDPALDQAELHFALAHLALRNYLGAMRAVAALQHNGQLAVEQARELAAGYAQQYRSISPLSPADILAAYRRRGWLLRALRAHAWLAQVSEEAA